MRDGWESEASGWAEFARTPGHDRTHDEINLPALLADAAALPFRDAAFDLVVAYMCLHDMDRMPQAVAEAARVLERGGRLGAVIPHPVNSAGEFQGQRRWQRIPLSLHLRAVKPEGGRR